MDKIAKLRIQLKAAAASAPVFPIHGTVKEITGDTCTVMVGELELTDVRLKATADGSETLLIIPAVDSNVMMISSDGSIDNLVVVKMDKLDKIIAENGEFKTEIDLVAGKVGIRNSVASLYELLDDLQTLLKNLKVFTPVGPSGTPLPDSIAAIVLFETKFKQLLIDN